MDLQKDPMLSHEEMEARFTLAKGVWQSGHTGQEEFRGPSPLHNWREL